MVEVSAGYRLAGEIFDTYRGIGDFITHAEVAMSEVTVTDEEIIARGHMNGEQATQRLSLNAFGQYYLATSFDLFPGLVLHEHVGPHHPDTQLDILTNSLFISAFKRLMDERRELALIDIPA